jgi:hypothetical protein
VQSPLVPDAARFAFGKRDGSIPRDLGKRLETMVAQ